MWRGGKNDTEAVEVVSRSGGGGVGVLERGDVASVEEDIMGMVRRYWDSGYC